MKSVIAKATSHIKDASRMIAVQPSCMMWGEIVSLSEFPLAMSTLLGELDEGSPIVIIEPPVFVCYSVKQTQNDDDVITEGSLFAVRPVTKESLKKEIARDAPVSGPHESMLFIVVDGYSYALNPNCLEDTLEEGATILLALS